MQFIKFRQQDSRYTSNLSDVIVNVSQIVKIEPRWFKLDNEGKRSPTYVGPDDDGSALLENTAKEYEIFDSLGKTYSSEKASPQGREFIEQLWKESI